MLKPLRDLTCLGMWMQGSTITNLWATLWMQIQMSLSSLCIAVLSFPSWTSWMPRNFLFNHEHADAHTHSLLWLHCGAHICKQSTCNTGKQIWKWDHDNAERSMCTHVGMNCQHPADFKHQERRFWILLKSSNDTTHIHRCNWVLHCVDGDDCGWWGFSKTEPWLNFEQVMV